MADEADGAFEEEQAALSAILSKRVQYTGESAHACEECGEEIPEARRHSVPGVRTCAECQNVAERTAMMMGRYSGST